MAIIRLGPTVIGIRGTVGGIVFTQNKSGPFARGWSRGANPRVPLQAAQRARLASIPELWRALTPAQQTAWDNFAALPAQDQVNRLGETFSLSGFGFFTKCNVRLLTIGRPTITASPVIPRPPAPTISTLQLPYLDAQNAFILYPAAEFPPTTDQIIELSQAISTGRQSSPTAQKTLKETQTPGDTESSFLLPYLNRFGPGSPSLKAFARVYRQTTEGLRSSASTLNFVSSDAAPYVAAANDYDGAANYALRGSDLTGNADSKVLLTSMWFRIDGGNATNRNLQIDNAARYDCRLDTANRIRIRLQTTAATTILETRTTTSFAAGSGWHNVIWAVDLATLTLQLAVDNTLESPQLITGPIDGTIDYTRTDHAFGGNTVGARLFDGCIAEYYFNNAATIDLAAPNALRLFVSPEGLPMFLGSDGSFPTDGQPIIYFAAADPSSNLGFGGNFVNQAALNACSDAP